MIERGPLNQQPNRTGGNQTANIRAEPRGESRTPGVPRFCGDSSAHERGSSKESLVATTTLMLQEAREAVGNLDFPPPWRAPIPSGGQSVAQKHIMCVPSLAPKSWLRREHTQCVCAGKCSIRRARAGPKPRGKARAS